MKVRWLLPGLVGVVLFSAPARAGRLESWNYNPNLRQIALKTDEGVQPKAFLLANPGRLVIDLPGIIIKSPQTNKITDPSIQEIRVGQFDKKTSRLVVELAPGYTLDPNKVKFQRDSLSRWNVQLPSPERGSLEPISQTQIDIPLASLPPYQLAGVVPLKEEMPGLQPQIEALMARYSFLDPGMFFLDLDTGNYLDISGDRVFPAASTIKFPVLVAFFQDLDAGKVKLDETLVMRRDLVAKGSGSMQYQRPGTKFSAKETAEKMIIISDNTATNMIIDRLGGKAKLTERFRSWGLQDTAIRNMLGDFKGTNTTSSADMVRLFAMLANQKLVSPSSQKQLLDIMRRTKTKTLLPAGLGSGATISHKTGDIGFLIGDTGMITMPNGKRYLAGIFVRRPYDDVRGRNFVREVSAVVYKYMNQQSTATSGVSSKR